jgi:CheY-like chemotaxis protein
MAAEPNSDLLCHYHMPSYLSEKGGAPVSAFPRPFVVVLDDSLTVRTLISVTLHREGCRVIGYAHPYHALQDLMQGHQPPPDVLFVNLILPQMNGFAVLRLLRSQPQFAHTALIVISRLDGVVDRLRARLLGATAYLTKPFTQEQLVRLVREYSPH